MSKGKFNAAVLKQIGRVADRTGTEVYAVGGYVRDRLLDRPVREIDFVVIGDGPAFARKVAHDLSISPLTVYRKFGTAMLRTADYTLEFVTARKESYRSDSRKPDVERADLLTDLSRRDFTINALAVSINGKDYGALFDPYNGRHDLEQKLIRTPLQPEKTFHDDPLRTMRAIRFACQLGFSLEPRTREGLAAERERLEIVSQERITDELCKILLCSRPSIGLQLMHECGVMGIVLPEIAALEGVDQIGRYRHKDVLDHTLKVVDNVAAVCPRLNLRMAALYHDVAKPATREFKPESGWTFHGHDELGARMMKSIGARLRLSGELIDYCREIIRLHLRPIALAEEGVTDSAIRRLLFAAGDLIDDLITLCRADITSMNPKRVARHLANFDRVVQRMKEVEEKDRLRQFQPPVRGHEIMQVLGLEPGPLVGVIKKAIEEAILNGDIPNEHDAAFEYMMRVKDDLIGKNSV